MEEGHNLNQNTNDTLSPTPGPSFRKFSILILIITLLLTIIVIVTIIIIKNTHQTAPTGEDNITSIIDNDEINQPSIGEKVYGEAMEIIHTTPEDPYNTLTTYFDELLTTATPQDLFDIESVHTMVLFKINRYNEALPVIDKMQELATNDDQLITVYNYYSTAYGRTCESASKSKEYQAKAQELLNKTQENW